MISIRKSKIPKYLQNSEYYKSIQSEDLFELDEEHYREEIIINSFEDLIIYIRILDFWLVNEIPYEFYDWVFKNKDKINIEILNGSGDEGASGLITMTSLGSAALEYVIYINNAGESVDPYADAFQTSYTGGKSYIAHDSAGSIWYDSASSDRGYSIELNLKISPTEDSLRPIEGKAPDLFGMYVNDGSFEQEIQLYSDSIFISRLGRRFAIDLTDFTNLRFNSHNGQMQIWKKSSTDRDYSLLGDLCVVIVRV
jgi:hypothetical protein